MLYMYILDCASIVRGANNPSEFDPADNSPRVNFAVLHAVLVTGAAGLVATYVFLWALLHLTQDVREPPLLSTAIPFLSPVIGAVRWSMECYTHMRYAAPQWATPTPLI